MKPKIFSRQDFSGWIDAIDTQDYCAEVAQQIFEVWLEQQTDIFRISCPVWIEEKDLDLETRIAKAKLCCVEAIK